MYPVPRSTLRDYLAKTYTLDEHMAEKIYDGHLKEGKIQPMISKRPAEVVKVTDPCYCHYHQFVTHSTNDCFTLKNAIHDLIDATILTVRVEEVPQIDNMTTVTFGDFQLTRIVSPIGMDWRLKQK